MFCIFQVGSWKGQGWEQLQKERLKAFYPRTPALSTLVHRLRDLVPGGSEEVGVRKGGLAGNTSRRGKLETGSPEGSSRRAGQDVAETALPASQCPGEWGLVLSSAFPPLCVSYNLLYVHGELYCFQPTIFTSPK